MTLYIRTNVKRFLRKYKNNSKKISRFINAHIIYKWPWTQTGVYQYFPIFNSYSSVVHVL